MRIRQMFTITVLALGLLIPSGCSDVIAPVVTAVDSLSPSAKLNLAHQAGDYATLAYLMVANPSAEEVAAINAVVTQIESHTGAIPTGGYQSLQPDINSFVDSTVSNPTANSVAKAAAGIILAALDGFINLHPAWVVTQDLAASITSSFCAGVSSALTDYVGRGLEGTIAYRLATGQPVPTDKDLSKVRSYLSKKQYRILLHRAKTPVYEKAVEARDIECKDGKCKLK